MITAVFKTTHKENEKRIPIYPDHINEIPSHIKDQLIFEKGYATDYGYDDSTLESWGCKLATIEDLYKQAEVLLLPKPTAENLLQMHEGQILCGWNHAVQQQDIADIAIRNKLTLISWENMNHITPGSRLHIFYRNNELAGYAGILHFLQLEGIDGLYGPRKKVIVLGYGSVSRGALYALQGRGFNNITVYTQRPTHLVADKNPDVWYKCFTDKDFARDLAEADIIMNGILQDVTKPIMFINDLEEIKPGAAIIDISCDKGMGFPFAIPTTFEQPIINLGQGVKYYSVDHTPTYLWNAASREISKALLPYLEYIIDKDKWTGSKTIIGAIDILDGAVINQNIIKFQK